MLLNLIKSVRNHPKLYTNLTKNVKNDVEEWTAVAQECDMTITEAQDQWNALTIEYMEYLKSNQNFNLAQQMDFLQPYFFAISDNENIDEIELLNAIGSKHFEEINLFNEEDTKNEEETLKTCTNFQKHIKTETATTEIHRISDCSYKIAEVKPDYTARATPQDNSITNMSSMELIFLGYAKQLQKMPYALQLKTKRKIADIMDEAEHEMMS